MGTLGQMSKAAERRIRAFGGYQPGLDGIRGLGMFAMLGYHAEMSWADGAFLSLSQFFTLSGFLITAILLDSRRRTGTIDLPDFWARRFRRLAPAAFVGLAGVAVFGATVATRDQAEGLAGEVLGVVGYVVNWVFVRTDQSYTDLFASPSPVNHYWSLAVEEQFYLFIPLVLFGLFRIRAHPRTIGLVVAAAGVLSTAWMFRLYDNGIDLDRLYYGTDTRLAEVMVGALLAVILDTIGIDFAAQWRRVAQAAGVAAFGVLAWLWVDLQLTDSFTWQGAFQLNAVLTAVMIVAIVSSDGPLSRFYAIAPLAWLGRLSYGVYIFHFPIYLWLTEERTGLSDWPLFALRVVVSISIAVVSKRFIEDPIRRGATFGLPTWARVAAYPVIGAALVGIVALTANTDGEDPLATLRDDGGTTVAVGTEDGVLDMLVIHGDEAAGELTRLASTVDDDPALRLTAVPFTCVPAATDASCTDWVDTWPTVIEDADPDVVIWLADRWPDEVAAAVPAEADAAAWMAAAIDEGVDVLAAEGAAVVHVAPGATVGEQFARAVRPFMQAMDDVLASNDHAFSVLSGAMPDPSVVTDEDAFLDASVDAILDAAALYQRADRAGQARVLVVGDSQARSFGYGLERWGNEEDLWVWNVAVNGCGLADEGVVYGSGSPQPLRDECLAVIGDLERRIASFEPEVVVVLSSVWDLGERRLDEWAEPLTIGSADFDSYLLREYRRAAEVLGAGGAEVVWMRPPCPGERAGVGSLDDDSIDLLDSNVLTPLGEAMPEVRFFDLDAVLCPDGESLEEVEGVGLLRADGFHFGVESSIWFAENYGDVILGLEGS